MRRLPILVVLTVIAALGWTPAARGADPPPPFSFRAAAGTAPISVAFTQRGSPADPNPLVSTGVAVSTAAASSVPLASARGSLIDPAPYTLVLLEVARNAIPQAPGFPTSVVVTTPGSHAAETLGAVDTRSGGVRIRGGRGAAAVDDSLQPRSDAQVGDVAIDAVTVRDAAGQPIATAPGVAATSARSETKLTYAGGVYAATTVGEVTGIDIQGVVSIGSVRTTATVAGGPGAPWTRSASVRIADMRVAGSGVVIGPEGIEVAGDDVPDVLRQALTAADAALAPYGGAVHYAGAGVSAATSGDVDSFANGLVLIFSPTDPQTGEQETTSQLLLGHSVAAMSVTAFHLQPPPLPQPPPPAELPDEPVFQAPPPAPPPAVVQGSPAPTVVSGVQLVRATRRVKSPQTLALLLVWLVVAAATTVAGARWVLGERR